jgi:acetyl-CoA synthetase
MTEQSTTRAIIAKSARARAAVRHLHDYAEACATFSWEQERAALCEPGHVNIADIALDLHVRAGRGDHMALRWRGRDDAHRDLTFAELKASSERFSGLLRRLGVGAGDVVAVLMPRRPELFAAAFGTWRNRSLFCPLFAAFWEVSRILPSPHCSARPGNRSWCRRRSGPPVDRANLRL